MTETTSKSVSTLAITEKRPQRTGSCVGIFFQLFDWNRRLAKKKLFSKKLFPPVGAKRISNKFGSDEKLPMAKLLLIADENRGGFPSMKKTENDSVCRFSDAERNNGMRTPGVVARLMGLESMPVVRRDNPKKPPVSDFYYNKEGKPVKHVDNIEKTSEFCYDRNLNSEKGHSKVDSRPQKLQKTGFFDRRPVTKLGAEALQLKNVLSLSRKQHHKFVSPVKSPRNLSGKSAFRLMEAATKILEPGLQAKNRAKCSLTYSTSPSISVGDQAGIEGKRAFPLEQNREPTGHFAAKSLIMQSTCNNCGSFLGTMEPNGGEFVNASFLSEFTSLEFSNASSQGSGKSMKSPKTSLEQDGEDGGSFVFPKRHEGVVSLAAQAKANVQKRTQNFMDGKVHIQRGQDSFSLSRESKPQLVIDPTALKQNAQKRNQVLPAKDRVPERQKLFSHHSRRASSSDAFNRTQDHVALNRNLSGHTIRTRTPTRGLDNCKIQMDMNSWEKKDDYFLTAKTLARKRRPVDSSPQVDNKGLVTSTPVKQRSIRSDAIHRNGSAPNVRSGDQKSVKAAFKKAEGNGARNIKSDTVSFTFSSSMRHDTRSSSPVEMKKRYSQGEVSCSTSLQDEWKLDAKNGKSSPLRVTGLKGDALGAFLEQKLRELTCLGRDESATGDTLSGRSTASILQELISALSTGRPISQENGDNCSDGFNSMDGLYNGTPECSDCTQVREQVPSPSSKFQAEAKPEVSIRFLPLAADCDHHSPTSILEASFSDHSCFSESLNGCSGHKLVSRSMCSHDQTQPQIHDPDLLDSATSKNSRMVRIETSNNISSMLGIDTAEIGFKLNYGREVILNAELLFENLARYDADDMDADTFVDPLLLNKLEALAHDLWGWPKCGLGVQEAKEQNQFREFLFDCMVECLDSRYGCYLKSGFNEWSKLPLSLSRGRLAREIYEDIRRWRDLAGKGINDMVEREMSNSLGKWTDFKAEAFGSGVEIEMDILQILLDDLVMDLCQCSAGS